MEMIKTLEKQKDPEGVGLAAPQVGLPWRLFIIKPTKTAPIEVFVNPEIVVGTVTKEPIIKAASAKASPAKAKLEGCLSIPVIWGYVDRNKQVTLSFQDLTGQTITKTFSGFKAHVMYHEMDHLDGILFTKRALEQKGKLYKEINGELEEYKI